MQTRPQSWPTLATSGHPTPKLGGDPLPQCPQGTGLLASTALPRVPPSVGDLAPERCHLSSEKPSTCPAQRGTPGDFPTRALPPLGLLISGSTWPRGTAHRAELCHSEPLPYQAGRSEVLRAHVPKPNVPKLNSWAQVREVSKPQDAEAPTRRAGWLQGPPASPSRPPLRGADQDPGPPPCCPSGDSLG